MYIKKNYFSKTRRRCNEIVRLNIFHSLNELILIIWLHFRIKSFKKTYKYYQVSTRTHFLTIFLQFILKELLFLFQTQSSCFLCQNQYLRIFFQWALTQFVSRFSLFRKNGHFQHSFSFFLSIIVHLNESDCLFF